MGREEAVSVMFAQMSELSLTPLKSSVKMQVDMSEVMLTDHIEA